MSKSSTTTKQAEALRKAGLPVNRRPTTPGEVLKEEFLVPLALTVTEFAKRIGVGRVRLSEIINGKRGVSPDTAVRLGRALKTTPQLWLNLQQAVDLYDAIVGDAEAQNVEPIAELVAA
jgi:addiction module HigA family antidote